VPAPLHVRPVAGQRPAGGPDAPPLRFEAFTAEPLAWVRWWNTENVMPALAGRTPLQAWLADPTPLATVPAADLRLLMLEDDGRTRKITTKGVAWRSRQTIARAWPPRRSTASLAYISGGPSAPLFPPGCQDR